MFGCCSFLMIIKWPCLLKHRKMPNPDLLYWNCKVDVLMVQLYTTHRRLNSLVSGRAQLKRPFDHRKMMKNGWRFSYLVNVNCLENTHTQRDIFMKQQLYVDIPLKIGKPLKKHWVNSNQWTHNKKITPLLLWFARMFFKRLEVYRLNSTCSTFKFSFNP